MKLHLRTSVSIVVFLWASLATAKFPNNPKPCPYGDSECIKKMINFLFGKKADGYAPLNLVSLDPLKIAEMVIRQGKDSPVGIDLKFQNAELFGFKDAKAVEVKGFGEDITQPNGVVLHVPAIYFLADYRIKGKVLILPMVGSGRCNLTMEFISYLTEITKQYKSPCISWMGSKCFLYAADPETIETVFNSPHCTNKGDFYKFMASSIGDGLFTSSSPRWNKHRKLINPAFSRQIISNFMPIFDSAGDVLIQIFKKSATEKQDVYDLLKKCVLEAACQTTMGKKMEIQNDGCSELFEAYKNIMDVSVQRMLTPWLYPDVIYKFSSLHALERRTVKVLYDFIENLLRGKPSKDTNKLDNEYLSKKSKSIFVEQVRNYVEQGQLTFEDIRDEANVIIAATFETTSTALYLVTLCLAFHPEYQEKLFEELLSIFPNKDFNISKENLEEMPYTEMVINEGMRLFSPVPMVIRTASEDLILKNGVTIPRGTQIGIDIFNMQRNSDFWGPKAMEFYPDHFHPDNLESRHPFAFVPFTKGLRMCIGNRYALMLMKVLIAKIFRNFEIRTDMKLEDLVIKGTISLKLRKYPGCTIQERAF